MQIHTPQYLEIILRCKFHFAVLLIVTFCLSSATAQTNRWSYIGTNAAGAIFYLDLTTIEKSNNSVRLWDKTIFPDGSYQINLSQWECDRRQSIVITSNIYEPSGDLIKIRKGEIWMDVTPNSISEKFYDRVCRAKSSRSLTDKSAQSEILQARVKTAQANVRNLPMMEAEVIGKVRKGEYLRLVTSTSSQDWYQVYFGGDNKTAWIHGSTIEIIQAGEEKDAPKKKTKMPKSINDFPAVEIED